MKRSVELISVSQERDICRGYHQKYVANGKYEILLNKMAREVKLASHSHSFAQFGYCFSGRLKLLVRNEVYLINQNDSFNLMPDIAHAAEILDDAAVMDFKYCFHGAWSKNVEFSVLKLKKNAGGTFYSSGISVVKPECNESIGVCTCKIHTSKDTFIVAAQNTAVSVDNSLPYLLEPDIYKVTDEGKYRWIELSAESGNSVLILQIED